MVWPFAYAGRTRLPGAVLEVAQRRRARHAGACVHPARAGAIGQRRQVLAYAGQRLDVGRHAATARLVHQRLVDVGAAALERVQLGRGGGRGGGGRSARRRGAAERLARRDKA
jgi:hypothetical protein